MSKQNADTKDDLIKRAEALDAEHARIMEQITTMNAMLTTVGLARNRAWNAVDRFGRKPRPAPVPRDRNEWMGRAFASTYGFAAD